MDRLTSDNPVKEMGMLELACNCTFIKNGDAWYRDYEREINVRDLVRAILSEYESEEYDSEYNSDDRLDEYLQNWMQLCPEDNFYGLLTAFYNMVWSHAELRERLKHYEDLEEQEKLLKLPCNPGDTVWITESVKYTKKIGINEVVTARVTGICSSQNEEGEINWCIRLFTLYGEYLIPFDKFGKIVFLTEQEAKEALEGMKK